MNPPAPHDPESPDEARDPAWALLDRARRVKVSPHFSRHVLSAVRAGRDARDARWAWLRHFLAPAARPALAMAALTVLAGGLWLLRPSGPSPLARPAPPALAAAEAAEIVDALTTELALLEDVDSLLAPEDGLDLEEEDVGRLLF